MADLTTLETVKSWLDAKSTTDDVLLSRLITAVSAWIETYTNRSFLSASYTENRDGNGGVVMFFANYPVTAIATVKVNTIAIAAADDAITPGYRWDSKRIWLQGPYSFTVGMGNIELVYTAGYAAIPTDVAQAAIDIISLLYRNRERIGHVSKSLNGETVAFITKAMPDSAKAVLDSHMKVIWP